MTSEEVRQLREHLVRLEARFEARLLALERRVAYVWGFAAGAAFVGAIAGQLVLA